MLQHNPNGLTLARQSHFDDPIPDDGLPHGNSRRWGDASPEVKQQVISALVSESAHRGLGRDDIAHVLAIARIESGFNPDAAATSTSASGLGQFIKATGAAYGLEHANRFDIEDNAKALVAHFIDNKELARENGKDAAWIYKYHHDGPKEDFGGLELARTEVIPYAKEYAATLEKDGHDAVKGGALLAVALEGSHASHPSHSSPHSSRAEGGIHEAAPEPFPKSFSDGSITLTQALTEHLKDKGFDDASIAQVQALVQKIEHNAGTRDPAHEFLVLQKDGSALATMVSAQEAEAMSRSGASVLPMAMLEDVARNGLDEKSLPVTSIRGVNGPNADPSNLELAARSLQPVSQVALIEAATERAMQGVNSSVRDAGDKSSARDNQVAAADKESAQSRKEAGRSAEAAMDMA
ncbi:lytic transglycosylase domain-containing protein [Paraburkholderia sp. UCT31]|uniref:lytic transglycosylase domain-containing protein n=1 Tax=Paraburkholderia sp. UCT31 TaxID=2615209 RepID=UPI0016551519|nr:lytic transglycosylase domain-containing protein [Paraburkholderia sp. UCT31]MBC8739802.1 lytic transglycosylase domain-containing protein [Paraburkholderia sp. UCT31]